MSTANKLTYLNDTKGLLKQKINNLGGDITDNTTFREYADKLQTIYDKFPKTDYEEGSNISLSNCLKGKLDFEDDIVGYGDTKQEGTPTPDNPQEIQVITGEQEVTIRGINLLPNNVTSQTISGITVTKNDDGTIKLNGTSTAQFEILIGNSVLKAGTYTGNCGTNATTTTYYIRLGKGNVSSAPFIANITDNSQFTLSEETNCYAILIIRNGVTINNVTIYPQIIDGTTALPYEPYITPITKQLSLGDIELAKIGNYRDYIWKDRSTKKWYKRSAIDKFLINSNLQITFSTSTVGYDLARIDNVTAPNVERPIMSSAFIGIIPEYGTGGVPTNRNPNNIYVNYSIQRIDICTVKNAFSSANDFITQLNGTPIYYAKTTATDTEITDTSLIEQLEDIYNSMSLNGTTIIEINGTLPMIMKVRALKGES